MMGVISCTTWAVFGTARIACQNFGFNAAPDDCYVGRRVQRTTGIRLRHHETEPDAQRLALLDPEDQRTRLDRDERQLVVILEILGFPGVDEIGLHENEFRMSIDEAGILLDANWRERLQRTNAAPRRADKRSARRATMA